MELNALTKYQYMKRNNFMILILFLFPLSVFCQVSDQQMEKMLKDELDSLSAGGKKIYRIYFNSSNEKYFLDFLKNYESSPVEMVQIRVIGLKYQIAMGSVDTLLRQRVVREMVSLIDKGSVPISQYVVNRLVDFGDHDYSNESRKKLEEQFLKFQKSNNFILICGIAQVRILIPALRSIASKFNRKSSSWFNDPSWFAHLALARMQAIRSIDTIIAAVELYAGKVFKVSRLLQLVAYTKHPDAIHLLSIYLQSGDVLSISDGGTGIPVNLYALEYLAIYIENFPVKIKYLGYSPEDIKLGIAYMNKIDNYHILE